MTDQDKCARCHLPIIGTTYMLRVDSDPAPPEILEFVMCENCMESMSRWLARRQRANETFVPGADPQQEAASKGGSRAKGRGRRTFSVYANDLSRDEAGLQAKMVLAILAGIAGLATVVVLFGYTLIRS
jgi:hypothetical protein